MLRGLEEKTGGGAAGSGDENVELPFGRDQDGPHEGRVHQKDSRASEMFWR